jgi:hypothetical protein
MKRKGGGRVPDGKKKRAVVKTTDLDPMRGFCVLSFPNDVVSTICGPTFMSAFDLHRFGMTSKEAWSKTASLRSAFYDRAGVLLQSRVDYDVGFFDMRGLTLKMANDYRTCARLGTVVSGAFDALRPIEFDNFILETLGKGKGIREVISHGGYGPALIEVARIGTDEYCRGIENGLKKVRWCSRMNRVLAATKERNQMFSNTRLSEFKSYYTKEWPIVVQRISAAEEQLRRDFDSALISIIMKTGNAVAINAIFEMALFEWSVDFYNIRLLCDGNITCEVIDWILTKGPDLIKKKTPPDVLSIFLNWKEGVFYKALATKNFLGCEKLLEACDSFELCRGTDYDSIHKIVLNEITIEETDDDGNSSIGRRFGDDWDGVFCTVDWIIKCKDRRVTKMRSNVVRLLGRWGYWKTIESYGVGQFKGILDVALMFNAPTRILDGLKRSKKWDALLLSEDTPIKLVQNFNHAALVWLKENGYKWVNEAFIANIEIRNMSDYVNFGLIMQTYKKEFEAHDIAFYDGHLHTVEHPEDNDDESF